MGIMNLFKKNQVERVEIQTEPDILYQPAEGEVIPLEKIEDEIFAAGILGWGCGLKPAGECIYAPVDGVVSMIAETKHAIGIQGDHGTEILIHVGLDTVDMNGRGFEVKVKAGEKVQAGQLIMKFSKKEIAAAGHPDTTAVLVTNADSFQEVNLLRTGTGPVGEKLLQIKK